MGIRLTQRIVRFLRETIISKCFNFQIINENFTMSECQWIYVVILNYGVKEKFYGMLVQNWRDNIFTLMRAAIWDYRRRALMFW